MNKVCIVGCRDLVIDQGRGCRIGGESFSEGDHLSLDGHSGGVYSGKLHVVVEKPVELLATFEKWRRVAKQSHSMKPFSPAGASVRMLP
jgi:pyruvate,orthophosphate dikinase